MQEERHSHGSWQALVTDRSSPGESSDFDGRQQNACHVFIIVVAVVVPAANLLSPLTHCCQRRKASVNRKIYR